MSHLQGKLTLEMSVYWICVSIDIWFIGSNPQRWPKCRLHYCDSTSISSKRWIHTTGCGNDRRSLTHGKNSSSWWNQRENNCGKLIVFDSCFNKNVIFIKLWSNVIYSKTVLIQYKIILNALWISKLIQFLSKQHRILHAFNIGNSEYICWSNAI